MRSIQIHMSNSRRSRAQSRSRMGVIHRPLSRSAPGLRLHFFSLDHEGAERRNGAGNNWAPHEGARVPCDRHARLPALHRGGFLHGLRTSWPGPEGLPLTLSGQHWRCRSSRPVQPLKAAPSSGAGGDRASWDEVTSLACRRHTLLRQLDVPRRRPHVSKVCRHYRGFGAAQD